MFYKNFKKDYVMKLTLIRLHLSPGSNYIQNGKYFRIFKACKMRERYGFV